MKFFIFIVAACAGKDDKNALLIIDVQDCFLDKCNSIGIPGSLQVQKGHEVIPAIDRIRSWTNPHCDTIEDKGSNSKTKPAFFNLTIYSLDAHTPNHISFASTHKKTLFSQLQLFCNTESGGQDKCCTEEKASDCGCVPLNNCRNITQTLWPDHCVHNQDNFLAKFNPPPLRQDTDNIKWILKGRNPNVDSYSALFENLNWSMKEVKEKTKNDPTGSKNVLPTLHYLKSNNIKHVYVTGLATDFCVKFSALDARASGFDVTIIRDGVRGIWDPSPTATESSKKLLEEEFFSEMLETYGIKSTTIAEMEKAGNVTTTSKESFEETLRHFKKKCNAPRDEL